MAKNWTFGEYIRTKRKEKDINQKDIARVLKISATFLYDLEKNNRLPPSSPEVLDQYSDALRLTEAEKIELYDLAAEGRGDAIPADIAEYVKTHKSIWTLIRSAKAKHFGNKEWENIKTHIR